MTLRQAQGDRDADLAAAIAAEAGQLLLDVRGRASGHDVGAEGDRLANALILARLAEARPDDAVLSEERVCDGARLSASRVWIVDPLDGTREFSEGRDDWAVHVGLAVDGVAVAGAVALPALAQLFASNGGLERPLPNAPPRIVVSRTRPPAAALRVAEAIRATLISMGSAGAKAMAVVRGDAEIYLHSGGQHEWDNCAPVAVALAHGLHCSRLDGSALRYNAADPYLPDLLICDPALATEILALLK